jgi:hypothetical protein
MSLSQLYRVADALGVDVNMLLARASERASQPASQPSPDTTVDGGRTARVHADSARQGDGWPLPVNIDDVAARRTGEILGDTRPQPRPRRKNA